LNKRKDVDSLINSMDPTTKWLISSELAVLPTILQEDEIVEKIIRGHFNKGNGILVATSKRLLLINKKLISLKVEDIPFNKISSIKCSTGLVFGKIEIYLSSKKLVISKIQADEAQTLSAYISTKSSNDIDNLSQTTNTSINPQKEQKAPQRHDQMANKQKNSRWWLIWSVIFIVLLYGILNIDQLQDTTSTVSSDSNQSIISLEQATIVGLMESDITTLLKNKWNLSFTGSSKGETLYLNLGKYKDPASGVMLICDIYENSSGEVIWFELTIDGLSVENEVDPSQIDQIANEFFKTICLLDYLGHDTEQEFNWINTNYILAKKEGDIYTTTIGQVKYNMYGQPYFRVFEIISKDADTSLGN
jgi:hypothetical protein